MDRFEEFEQIKITNVKRNRAFLEIYGHKRPMLLEQLESRIIAFEPNIRKKSELQSPPIEFDTIYLAESKHSKKYHRCVVVEKKLHYKVVIDLIDFGCEFEVDAGCLLELDENDEMSKFLRDLPPIATKYFLCGFFCTWRNNEFMVIEQLLKNTSFRITNEQTDREYHYISLEFRGRDLTDKLTSDSIGIAISFTEHRIAVRQAFQRGIDVDEQMYQSRSPVKRTPARRNLVANRPLQSTINNNVIANQGKRLIEGHIGMNVQHHQKPQPRSDVSQVDGASLSVAASQMPAFIANDLPIGPYHIVYCSYVEDGPSLFSVQLKNHEHILNKMAFDLGNVPRIPITTKMMIGMACLARYSEDSSLYRAVIQKVQANGCRVTFIDYGNSDFVPFTEIFQIPKKFLEHKIFSVPFQLAGIKRLQPIDERLNEYFKAITGKTELELKVVPSDNPQIQQCELFIEAKSVLEILLAKQTQSNTFSAPPALKDGEKVIIRYAQTAKQFYLQRSIDTKDFDEMMDALLLSCANTLPMRKLPVEGECCAAMHKDDDTEFYRAIVTNKIDERSVSVRLVDYGVDLNCGLNKLREMDSSFFELPQQAIECCLVDFENVVDVSTSTGEQISMLIDDKDGNPNQFRVSVRRRMENGIYLVDLRDEVTGVNVSSSIYKLAMPRKYPNTRKDLEKSSNEESVQQNTVRNPEKPMEPAITDNNKRNGESNRYDNEKAMKTVNNNNNNNNYNAKKRLKNDNKPQEIPQKMILQKHIIPCLNKRHNRSSHPNQDGKRTVGVDGNDNYMGCTATDSAGFPSSDVGTREKVEVIESAGKPVAKYVLVGFNPVLPDQFPIPKNATTGVRITSWESPMIFHIQLRSFESDCEEMMQQMQQFYKNRDPVQQRPSIGSLVVVQHKNDHEFQRGKVIDYNEARNKYKVRTIDFGDVCIYQQTDLFEMEQSFIRLPPMAICCSMGRVIMAKSKKEILESIERHTTQSNQIECEFGNTDDEIKEADILIKGESLKELLIKTQLIVSIPKNVRLERLIGQKVMLHTTFATELTRFQAKLLGCDILYMFSYKDLDLVKKNERLNEEFRVHIETNKCIKAQIESIDAENIFHVSIYLPSLDKDINEGEIIGFPIFGDEFKCEITHFETPHIFYVQNVDNTTFLDKIFEDMTLSFQKSDALNEAPKLGELYSAISSIDEQPYRCKIERLCENGTALVRWIDYGNCEYVPFEKIKELRKDLKLMCALASKVFTPIETTDADVDQEIFDYVNSKLNDEMTVKILDIHKSDSIVEIKIKDEDLYAQFESAKKIRRLSIAEFIKTLAKSKLNRPMQEEAAKMVTEKGIQEEPAKQIEKEIRVEAVTAITVHTEPIHQEPVHTETIHQKTVHTEPIHQEPVHTKPIHPEPVHTEPMHREPVHTKPIQQEPLHTKPIHPEPVYTEPIHPEPVHTEPIRADPPKTPAVKEASVTDIQLSPTASETNASDKAAMAYITHVDHPNQFYLQLDSDSDDIATFEGKLQIVAASLSPLQKFRRGNLCIAKYTYDDQWYRAKIIDSDGETTSVHFIDYGNTDTITDNSLLKSYDETFNEIKPFAMLCSLPVGPCAESAEWDADACQKLRDLIGTPVKFELISKYKEFNYVKLSVGGRDIVKDLIFGGLAEQWEIINSGEICYISHINNLNDFFVQVDSDVEALHLIEMHLSSASEFPTVDNPTKGTICAALYSDDGYYRAQIIDETPKTNGIKVAFLDYGNILRTNELRSLSPDIAKLPHLRRRCCLNLPDDVQSWNPEAAQQFSDLSDNGRIPFTVKLVKPGKRALVELFIGDENVAQKIGRCCEKRQVIDAIVDEHDHPIEKTPPAEKSLNLDGFTSGKHDGFISHINSAYDFFIQLSSKAGDLDVMCANLESAHDFEKIPFENANIGSIVAALYSLDNMYYRAKVMEQNVNGAKVFFIDYGNECMSADLRKLPDVLQSIEPLAVRVQLGTMAQHDLNETDHEQFLNLSSSDAETTFQIQFEDATNSKPIVHIWQDGKAIIEYLRSPRSQNKTSNQYTVAVDQMIEAAAKY